jgi:hypothetical protein
VSLRILVAPSAQAQLEELAAWWKTHGPAASTDLPTEFQRLVEVLSQMPFLGRRTFRGKVAACATIQSPARRTTSSTPLSRTAASSACSRFGA